VLTNDGQTAHNTQNNDAILRGPQDKYCVITQALSAMSFNEDSFFMKTNTSPISILVIIIIFLISIFLSCNQRYSEKKMSESQRPVGSALKDSTPTTVFVNPTGTYIFRDEIAREDTGITLDYKNEIRALLLDSNTVVISFFFCEGPPAYNHGYFLDTLGYRNNIAVYTCPEEDTTCILTLTFSKDQVVSYEKTADYNWGCGFGHGVVANGTFDKTSSAPPDMRELLMNDK